MWDEISVRVTNDKQTITWKGYGLRLCIPQGSLPAGHTHCCIKVRVVTSGHFQFPENSRPVSAIYWLISELKEPFSQPLTLEIQHCARRNAVNTLDVVRATTATNSLPYQFNCLKGGVFSQFISYGSIHLNHFSLVSIIWNRIRSVFSSPPLTYCCHMYYTKKTDRSCTAHVVITKDLESHIQVSNSTMFSLVDPDSYTLWPVCNSLALRDLPGYMGLSIVQR